MPTSMPYLTLHHDDSHVLHTQLKASIFHHHRHHHPKHSIQNKISSYCMNLSAVLTHDLCDLFIFYVFQPRNS